MPLCTPIIHYPCGQKKCSTCVVRSKKGISVVKTGTPVSHSLQCLHGDPFTSHLRCSHSCCQTNFCTILQCSTKCAPHFCEHDLLDKSWSTQLADQVQAHNMISPIKPVSRAEDGWFQSKSFL